MPTDYMQGWDSIVAVYQSQVNKGLQLAYNDDKIPKNFDLKIQVQFLGITIDIELKGTFGVMQIYGGTGTIIKVLLPIESGTVSHVGGTSIDISGVKAFISINLSYITSAVQPAEGFDYDIVMDFTKDDAWVGIDLADVPPALQQQETAIAIALTDYLRKETGDKSYKVATVNLKNFAAQPEFQYIVPKLVQYAMLTSSQSSDKNVFAMLMQSMSETPGKEQLLEGTIPGDSTSAVLISNPLFMRYVIAPAIAKGFNINQSDLIMSGDPTVISNNGDIGTQVDANGQKDITIKNLVVQISQESLSIDLQIKYTVSPGIDLIYTLSPARYVFEVIQDNGKQLLALKDIEFTSSKKVDIAWWVWVAGGAAAILTLPIASLIVTLVVAGIGVSVVAIIQAIVKGNSPELGASVFVDAAKPVTWNYSEIFQPQQILLPLSMQAGGTIPIK